jgi:hypothetical protein
MMTLSYQWIKMFAFNDSAPVGSGSLPAEEKRMRICCSRAGRPICSSENRENRIFGGHENERIKMAQQVKTAGEMEMFL